MKTQFFDGDFFMPARFHFLLLTLLVSFFCYGCQPSKHVTITSEPRTAKLFLQQVGGGDASIEEVGIGEVDRTLTFKEGISYKVIAKLYKYHDAEMKITLEPDEKRAYQIKLSQFLETIPTTTFEPVVVRNRPKTWALQPIERITEAYLDERENSKYVKSCEVLATNKDVQNLNYLTASTNEDIVVFQNIGIAAPPITYTVLADKESTESIARQFDLTPDEVRRMNNLDELEVKLRKGQVLKIAPMQVGSGLWRQTLTGSQFSPITNGKSLDLYPAFMPSVPAIVFASNRLSTHLNLWRTSTDGKPAVGRITNSTSEDYRPSIGPDGRIVFTSLVVGSDAPQIWSVKPDGSDLTQLPDGEYPQLSPNDGSRILFTRRNDREPRVRQLWTMAADGSDQRQITQNSLYEIVDPKWSPDGRRIVYAANEGMDDRKIANYDIWMVSADGSNKVQITRNGSLDDSPCWDRTGNAIYFRSNRGGQWRIWRAELQLP